LCTERRKDDIGEIYALQQQENIEKGRRTCIVHGSRTAHCLPDLAEVIHVVSKDNSFSEKRLTKLAMIDQLEWDVCERQKGGY